MSTDCQKFLQEAKQSVSWAFVGYLNVMNTVDKDSWYKTAGKSIALILTIPIAVIEGVVRGVLALLAIPGALLLPEGKVREGYNKHIFSPLALGSITSFGACAYVIVSIGTAVGTVFETAREACSTPDKIAKMPPNIWCCCSKSARKASS